MFIRVVVLISIILGTITGCSKNDIGDAVDNSPANQQSVEQVEAVETATDKIAVEALDVKETNIKVVEGMGHDYNDPYYANRDVQTEVYEAVEGDDGVVEGMGHDYNDPYYTDKDVQNEVHDAIEIDDGVVEGMGHNYNDPYYTDR